MSVILDPFQTIKAFSAGGGPFYRRRIAFSTLVPVVILTPCGGATVLPPALFSSGDVPSVKGQVAAYGVSPYSNLEKFEGGVWVSLGATGTLNATDVAGPTATDPDECPYAWPLADAATKSYLSDVALSDVVTVGLISYYTTLTQTLEPKYKYTGGAVCASTYAPVPGGDVVRPITTPSNGVSRQFDYDQTAGAIPDITDVLISGQELNIVGFMPDPDSAALFPDGYGFSVWAVGHLVPP